MTEVDLNSVFVMLCDWRGHCTWSSKASDYWSIGEFPWSNLDDESLETAKTQFSRVVTLRETQSIEVTNQQGACFRCWMWPLESPEVAVCVLGVQVPVEVRRLSKREKECLELLGQGMETGDIAKRLAISLSTVHTHLKRAREKLELPNVESLISFAARFCYPSNCPLSRPSA